MLMWDIHRTKNVGYFGDQCTVLLFEFDDYEAKFRRWWLVIAPHEEPESSTTAARSFGGLRRLPKRGAPRRATCQFNADICAAIAARQTLATASATTGPQIATA